MKSPKSQKITRFCCASLVKQLAPLEPVVRRSLRLFSRTLLGENMRAVRLSHLGLACLAVFGLSPSSGLAQSEASELASVSSLATNSLTGLTLAECQEIAQKQNRDRRMARNNLRSAVAGGRIAESEVFAPSLEISQTFTEDNDNGQGRAEIQYLSPFGIEISPYITEFSEGSRDERWLSTAGITLKRRIFSSAERWRLRMPITTAERSLLKAQNTLQLGERQLDFGVMRAFLALQRVDTRLRVRRNRVTDAKAFLNVTEERVATGLAPRVDIVNATINLNQAEADVLDEESNLQDQTESLLNVMGYPVTREISTTPYEIGDVKVDPVNLENDSIHLLARHESLVNARLDLDFSRIEMRIQKDLLRPQLGLAFTAEHRSQGLDPTNEQLEDSDPLSIALTYSVPLDGNKQAKARLRQLELALENEQLSLIDTEKDLLVELRAAHRSLLRLETQVGLSEQRLEAERAKLQATLVRYEDGNVDNIEVTRAKQALDDAEISLINTRIELVLAQEQYRSLLPPDRPVKTTLSAP